MLNDVAVYDVFYLAVGPVVALDLVAVHGPVAGPDPAAGLAGPVRSGQSENLPSPQEAIAGV